MSVKPLYLLALAMTVGCAPAPGTPGGAPKRSALLTADEIAGYAADGKNAYDVVSRLRPSWLRSRGVHSTLDPTDSSEFALVVVDGHPVGRIQWLREIEAIQVAEIRYSDPANATGSYGARGGSGAIEVATKASTRR